MSRPHALVCMLALCLGCGGKEKEKRAGDPCPTDTDAAWAAFTAELETHFEEAGLTGVAVALVEDGALCRTTALGHTDVDQTEALTEDHLFRWASVTKMHTAAAVLRLVEEGVVSLDAPVTDYVPYARFTDAPAGTPTVYQLLTHTSGVPDDQCADGTTDPGALARHFENNSFRLLSPPGAIANYSNPNYWLAGLILEEVDGVPYAEAMANRWLEPAGMDSATFDVFAAEAAPHALNTTFAGLSNEPNLTHCARSEPSGHLYASVRDVGRMLEILLAEGDGLLSSESALAMREQVDDGFLPDAGERYGYGLWTHPYKDQVAYIHSGSQSGYRSMAGFVPEAGFGVALVSNDPDFDRYATLDSALEHFLAPTEMAWPPDYSTPVAEWAKYEGTYVEPDDLGTITVRVEGSELLAELDTETIVLTQTAGDRFWWGGAGTQDDVIFWEDGGEVTWMATRRWVATRQ